MLSQSNEARICQRIKNPLKLYVITHVDRKRNRNLTGCSHYGL